MYLSREGRPIKTEQTRQLNVFILAGLIPFRFTSTWFMVVATLQHSTGFSTPRRATAWDFGRTFRQM